MPAAVALPNGTSSLPNGHGHVNGVASGSGSKKPKSRAALRRQKAKAKAAAGATTESASEAESDSEKPSVSDTESEASSATSLDTLNIDPNDPAYSAFANVFRHFQEGGDSDGFGPVETGPSKGEVYYSDEEDEDEESRDAAARRALDQQGMTRRQRRQAAKLTVAELKQLVERPEVVEWFDCDARDPRLLISLKSQRNTVPVPVHWNAKRDYLAGKRGIEKPPYLLPPWIAETGIGEQRDAVKAKEAEQTLRQKTRERVQPKMGKIDIDYQKLHDAFFRFQGKPSMSRFGEAYYEGKELETDLRTKKPGELSDELIEALSIPPLAPPPWLIAMQRFGPPPSYPNLRIKGLNAPIPPGAQWGFHPGGWGKPPMDDFNRPLYGDVFGVMQGAEIANQNEINRELWGEIEQMDEEEDEDEDEDEDEEEEASEPEPEPERESRNKGGRSAAAPGAGAETPSGLVTPSGFQSQVSTVPGGLETPEFIDLRKNTRSGTESTAPRELYQVVPERETNVRGFMGSQTGYDLGNISKGGSGPGVLGDDRGSKRKAGDVEIAMDGDEELTQAQLREKYEASRSEQNRVHVPGAHVDRSGFDDVVAGEMKKRQRKDDRGGGGGRGGREKAEKYKF